MPSIDTVTSERVVRWLSYLLSAVSALIWRPFSEGLDQVRFELGRSMKVFGMKVIWPVQAHVDESFFPLLLEEFDCCSADIDEHCLMSCLRTMLRMAVEKPLRLRTKRGRHRQTVVVLSGNICKTGLYRGCAGNLSALSGQTHQVMTAVAIMIDAELLTVISKRGNVFNVRDATY